MPKISVISGIYNCETSLPAAMDSILAQSVSDWEWILCDDASSDRTYEVARAYRDKYPDRFVLLRNETNRGLNYTLNRCLAQAKGEFIARMDGDDTCSPDRFEKELLAFEREPELAIVSTGMTYFDESGTWGNIHHPEYPRNGDFVHGTPFCHAPCMVRKSAYDAVHGYSESPRLLRVEDYHLWVKMYAAGFVGKNLPENLYQMRDDRNAYSRRKFRYRLNEAYVMRLAVGQLGLPKSDLVYSLRPVIVGLLPEKVYRALHKKRLHTEG